VLPQIVHAKPSLVPPIVATAASAALGIVGVAYFRAALDSADQAGKTDDHARYDKLVDEVRSRQHRSWLFGGIAGMGAIASAVLWYRYASAPRIEVQATGSGGAITIGGRW
jgi:hypothetical protein